MGSPNVINAYSYALFPNDKNIAKRVCIHFLNPKKYRAVITESPVQFRPRFPIF